MSEAQPRKNAAQLLKYAMENAGDDLQLLPCLPHCVGFARESKKHGRPASITTHVPDAVVKNLMDPATADLVMLVRIPREVVNRAELGLVTPGLVDLHGRRV